ncbi:stealth family protein [Pararhizobium gei]|uniref:stealth family protein n=1 Tax=Pararhizobium gei TaxID=1395951 RepID=UPI0023DBEB3C|nr:stealth family protein [Rhizobium gei]
MPASETYVKFKPGMKETGMEIDAVVTWVDGEDPRHQAKRALHQTENAHPVSVAPTRFASRGEIKYCLWSILTFCPFVRRVFIVTDGQRPDLLDSMIAERPDWSGRVEIVDHAVIYGEHADLLPVFSSRSIETMLHRIPDLAENFIYLNDDIFVGRPLTADYFFQGQMPVLRGRLVRFPNRTIARIKSLFRRGRRRAGFKEAQQQAARLVGTRDRYLLAEHHPHALRRSTMAGFFADKSAILRAQAGHRFRSPEQFSPIGLANHLELEKGAPVEAPDGLGYIKPPRRRSARVSMTATLDALVNGKLSAICVQSLDAMSEADYEAVRSGLDLWSRDRHSEWLRMKA